MQVKLKPPIKSIDQSILVKNDKMNNFYAPHHYHSDYEIIYIKKSFGIRIIGNNIDNYQAGEVVILGPGLPHYHTIGSTHDDQKNLIETIAVLFPQSLIDSNMQFPEFAQNQIILEKLKFGLELKKHTKKRVQEALEKMSLTPQPRNFFLLFSILEAITEEGASYTTLSTVAYDNKKIYNQKTKHILEFIANNYLSSVTVDKAAKQAELSKTGFCNFFKSQTGYTFSHYINMLRISKACELLSISPKNVSEIAYEIGYENLAYFNRKFKEIKELTPKEFRLKMLQ